MKTEEEIEEKLVDIDTSRPSKYYNMTYEQGVEEALMWVLEQVDDDEFNP